MLIFQGLLLERCIPFNTMQIILSFSHIQGRIEKKPVLVSSTLMMLVLYFVIDTTEISTKRRSISTFIENMEDTLNCLVFKIQGFRVAHQYRKISSVTAFYYTLLANELLFLRPYLNICQSPCLSCIEQNLQ